MKIEARRPESAAAQGRRQDENCRHRENREFFRDSYGSWYWHRQLECRGFSRAVRSKFQERRLAGTEETSPKVPRSHFNWHFPPFPRHDFLCMRNLSRKAVAAPSRPRMITSRRHPSSSFSDLPPVLQHIRHTTRDPGGSRIAVLWKKNHRFATGLAGHTAFGFCAAHVKSEPAREDASPPTVVQRHTIILWRHRIPVPRSNAEQQQCTKRPDLAGLHRRE